MNKHPWLVFCGLMACGGGAQDITSTTGAVEALPDLQGDYTTLLSELAGCEERPEVDPSWLSEGLQISGAPNTLEVVFPEVGTVQGSVDATFTVFIQDSVVFQGEEVALDWEALAYIEADLWVLDGLLFMDWTDVADSSQRCSMEASFEARQVL